MADVLILTGPPGAGKSTVAQALAERYDRVAHIQVDDLRHMITPTGYVHPGSRGEAWQRQWALSVRNACDLAHNFLVERLAVIIDDIVIDQTALDAYIEGLKACGVPVHYVRLMPRLDICHRRNEARETGRIRRERVETLWRDFDKHGAIAGATIDSSDLTAYETADRLQTLTTSGQSIVWTPRAPPA